MKPAPVRLLLISADATLAQALSRLLRPRFAAATARSVGEAREAEPPALVLIDEPTPDAFDRCAATFPDLPVLVVGKTAPPADPAPLIGFVGKPVRMPVLLQEIDRLLRLGGNERALTLGRYQFLPSQRMLTADDSGAPVHLTEKEAAILTELAAANGAVVPREHLLKEVWGYAEGVASHTLETHIYRLRRKLASPAGGALVVGSDGGYRLAL